MKRAIIFILIFGICMSLGFPEGSEGTLKKKDFYSLGDKPGNAPFSAAIKVGNTLYISGQLPIEPSDGSFINGSMKEQAERELKNIEILLKKAGMTLRDVVSATVYITDFSEFAAFNEVFRTFFPENPPTRATVQVAKLARDAKLEISAIAVK